MKSKSFYNVMQLRSLNEDRKGGCYYLGLFIALVGNTGIVAQFLSLEVIFVLFEWSSNTGCSESYKQVRD